MINAAALDVALGISGVEVVTTGLESVTNAFQTAVDTAAQAELSQLSLRSLVGSEMVATGQYRDLAAATDEATVYAQHLYDWTKRLAIQSPYESQDITNAVSLAQAYGFLSTQTTSVAVAQQAGVISTQRLTAATLDYLAAAGRPSHVLENIITPLGQIKAVGRATGEEMRQLSEWGVPVRRYLAEALNVSTSEIVQMQNEGRLLAEDVIPAIVEGFERDFGGAAASMGGTISGLLSSMSELSSYSLADFFGPTIEAGQVKLQEMVDALQTAEVKAGIQEWGETTASVLVTVGSTAETTATIISEGLVPALGGAAVAWTAYRAASYGTIGLAVAEGVIATTHAIRGGVAATYAWVAANQALLATYGALAVSAAAVGATIYKYQEHQRTLDDFAGRLVSNSDAWDVAARAQQAYANASPEVQERMRGEIEQLEQLQASTESATRADLDQASRAHGIHQSQAEAQRIATENARIRLGEVENLAQGILNEATASQASEAAALAKAEADRQAALEAERRAEQEQAFREDALSNAIDFGRARQEADAEYQVAITEANQAHADKLAEIDEQLSEKLRDERQTLDDDLLKIEQDRLSAIADERERHTDALIAIDEKYLSSLRSAADEAADASRSAFAESVSADVDFLGGSRDRLEEFNEKRRTIQAQGAWACYVDEEQKALVEQEAQQAQAYVEQEREQSAHLGRMLVDRATALALMNGISGEALNQMTAGIRQAFGVQASISDLMFADAIQGLDQWAASGGQNTSAVIAGFSQARQEAVRLTLAQQEMTEARTRDLAEARVQGRLTEEQYIAALQAVPGEVTAELGLSVSGPVESDKVLAIVDERNASIQEEEQQHTDKLVAIDQDANQKRTASYRTYYETITALQNEWYTQQVTAADEQHQADLEAAQTRHEEAMTAASQRYADQMGALNDHYADMDEAQKAYIATELANDARQAASLDADAQRQIDQVRADFDAGLLSYEQYVARLAEISMRAQQALKWLTEATPDQWGERTPRPTGPGQDPIPYAQGGSFGAYDLLRVGEYGQELVMFTRPGVVIPNNMLRSLEAQRSAPGVLVPEVHVGVSAPPVQVYAPAQERAPIPQQAAPVRGEGVTIQVNIHNPVVDTPEREQRLLATIPRVVQEQVGSWIDEVRATRRTQL